MYGKRLKDAEWEALRVSDSLREVWEHLRASGSWSAVGEDPACAGSVEAMTAALRKQVENDLGRICLYLREKDRETLRFYLRRPDGDMTPEEAKRWWRDGGAKKAGLRRIAGAEADALNLVYILRLRRFPASVDRAEELLIPVRDKLTADIVHRLLRAPDDREVMRVLSGTPWSGVFTSLEPGALEKQYSAYMEAFCRRIMVSARPGLIVLQAFLTMRDMECRKLTRLAAAVSRGVSPENVV